MTTVIKLQPKLCYSPPDTNMNTNCTRINQKSPLAASFCIAAVAACSNSLISTCCMQCIEALSNLMGPAQME